MNPTAGPGQPDQAPSGELDSPQSSSSSSDLSRPSTPHRKKRRTRRLARSSRGMRFGAMCLVGAVMAGGVTAIAFWAPREQAQLILPVFSTLTAAAITGWLSARRPRT